MRKLLLFFIIIGFIFFAPIVPYYETVPGHNAQVLNHKPIAKYIVEKLNNY